MVKLYITSKYYLGFSGLLILFTACLFFIWEEFTVDLTED